jgi:hypothetical protein
VSSRRTRITEDSESSTKVGIEQVQRSAQKTELLDVL